MGSTQHIDPSQPNVVVNVDTGANRPYQIVATLLLCGSVGMIAYSLALNGWLEIAATTLTMFLVQLCRLLFANGLLALPVANSTDEFAGTKGFLRTASKEFAEWQRRSPVWRLTMLAMGYTAAFMTMRWVMSLALHVFSNVWVAGAAAAFMGSLIIFPNLIGNAMKSMKSKAAPRRTTTDVSSEDEQQ